MTLMAVHVGKTVFRLEGKANVDSGATWFQVMVNDKIVFFDEDYNKARAAMEQELKSFNERKTAEH